MSDKMRDLVQKIAALQSRYYGDGMALHIHMIGWAAKAREALAEQPAPSGYSGFAKAESAVETYKTSRQPAQGEAVAVHQYRLKFSSDWHDGHPDPSDGHGPYETRTLYAAPPAPAVPMAPPVAFAEWLRSNMPPDTVISDPDWWAMAIWSAARRAINAAPVSTPAPSVPDDVAKDAARYRWLRDEGPTVICGISWRYKAACFSDEPDAAIDAAMLAAAPEVPRG